jgi:threonine dehydrogenase-like Zn-dependent dehydrogenase
MNALVLEDVGQLELRDVPMPVVGEKDVLVRVGAVGICGTDLHIFHGLANFHRDSQDHPIPLKQHPQILGHEFCGTVETVGTKVAKVKPGDRIVVDQFLNCWSQGRTHLCEYCETGDSHACEFGKEFGITGLSGAFADYIAVPETNAVLMPTTMTFLQGAIVEPLGCVLHAVDRMEAAHNRYTLTGRHRIKHTLILGAGPSGILFVQYLRNVMKMSGELFVADTRESRLRLAEKLGATPLNVREVDLITEVQRRTNGERVQFLIEASGSSEVFDWLPSIIRRQATVLIYGSGHSGRDIACLTPLKLRETVLVTSCGSSGGFDADGTPVTYRRSMEFIRDGKVNAEALITHRYEELVQISNAFSQDATQDDFIKGVLTLT